MKKKSNPAAATQALRLAAAKLARTRRVAEAKERTAKAAKLRFKDAKKGWKLARKTAKRSNKLVKLAERNLGALEKHVKRLKANSAGAHQPRPRPAANPKKRQTLKRRPKEITLNTPATESQPLTAATEN